MLSTAAYLNGDIETLAPGNGFLAQLVGTFSAESRAQFIRMAQIREVHSRTVLIDEDHGSSEMGFVLSGLLAVTKALAEGRVSIGALLLPTDLYGRVFRGPSEPRIEALSDAHVLSFKRTSFEALLRQEPQATEVLLAHVLEDLDRARRWTLLLNGPRVVSRVASFLVLLGRAEGQLAGAPEPGPVQVDLTREDLASYLGTRPETLSRAFHELANKKILRILDPARFEVLDLPALLDISGQELMTPERG